MQTAALIIETMERVAARAGDITEPVFVRYFEQCEGSRSLMSHMDPHMLGRMMEQVLLLLMEEGENELKSYLSFETANHASYGVQPYMYENLFAAVKGIVYESLEDLTHAERDAWDGRIGTLLREIKAASPV